MTLFQRDVAIELDVQLQRRDFQGYLRRKRLVASNEVVGDSLRHGMLDLALRIDADYFQELANADVKSFFVHEASCFSAMPELLRWSLFADEQSGSNPIPYSIVYCAIRDRIVY